MTGPLSADTTREVAGTKLDYSTLATLPSRMRSTSGIRASARSRHSSSERLDNGWGATAYSYSGTPIMRVMALAVLLKTWVMMDAVGRPKRSISMPSCTLHELHDPQSPTPVMSTSTPFSISSMTSGLVGSEAECLLNIRTSFSPYFS